MKIGWKTIAAAGLCLAAAFGSGGAWWALHWYESPGPSAEAKTVVIARNQRSEALAAQLGEAGLVNHDGLLPVAMFLTRSAGEIKAGEYAFPAGISPAGILELLRAGKTIVHRLTIPEGLSTAQIVALVSEAPVLDGTVTQVPGEGQLLPETYFYSWGDKRQALVDRMHHAMTKELDTLWAARKPGLGISTPEEALTLASVVEKETGIAAERPMIAGVFYNRLRLGMRLQSDPTVIYAVTHGAHPLDRALTKADLEAPSPYNTYLNKGLPPGPIANPGRAALKAVLDPAETDALYFVADGSGGHAFAATLDQHNKNVQHWRQIESTPK